MFLRERYTIFSTRLFGRACLLALESDKSEISSPGEYAKHEETLKDKLGEPVILVLSLLPSYARNRLVQNGVPFIVPGSQTFIPNTLIDLRERFPQPTSKARATLSPAAQCTVLYHLMRERITEKPLREIATKIAYSPMMLTKVKDELESSGICTITRVGRARTLNFKAHDHLLWDQVKSQLTSPVKRTHWIQWDPPPDRAAYSGMTALCRKTMLADDRLPTYALWDTVCQDLKKQGAFAVCHDAENATARLEEWTYDPNLLSVGGVVDSLSLYLSLRTCMDERVQQQLERLIMEFKW